MDKHLEAQLLLGKLVSDHMEVGVSEVRATHSKELGLASAQVGEAYICVRKAIDILEKIPSMEGTMLLFMLHTDAIRMSKFQEMLAHKPKD